MRWRDLLELNQQHPLPADFFDEPRRVHFLGIGGIGMSALAFLLKSRGHIVSGSDERDGAMLQKLRDAEIEIFIGHDARNVDESEALFISSAIPDDNAELLAARERKIPTWHRSQLMAYFSNRAKVSIAVSGTHGKSTTSAMISHILTECGHNPTAILGAVYPPFNGNFRIGDPDLVVVEADESDGSFTLLKPTVAVVLNVEPEHLENYDESEEELWRAFEMFVSQSSTTVCNADDKGLMKRWWEEKNVILYYGFTSDHSCDLRGRYLHSENGKTSFQLIDPNDGHEEVLGDFSIPVPGVHNVSNTVAAILTCDSVVDAPFEKIAHSISTFAGTLRRFERKGEAQGILVYDDYGHHPTEVRATLSAAREFLNRPICVVFQPHRYSRTQALHREFGSAFESADTVIITQLYSAHEIPIEGVSGRLVFDAVREHFPDKAVFYAHDLVEAKRLALEHLKSGDALLTMGAGDVTTLGPQILEALASE